MQIYLDYIDILHRVKQRGRPRDAAPTAAANELVLLRAKMVRVLHALPALVTGSSVTIEARYVSFYIQFRTRVRGYESQNGVPEICPAASRRLRVSHASRACSNP